MRYSTTRMPAEALVRIFTRLREQVGTVRNVSQQGICLSGVTGPEMCLIRGVPVGMLNKGSGGHLLPGANRFREM